MSSCDKCKKEFTTKYTLKAHLNKKIPCDRILLCDKCNKTFKTKYELTSHLKRKTPCFNKVEKNKTNLELEKLEVKKSMLLQKDKDRECKLQIHNDRMSLQQKEIELRTLEAQNESRRITQIEKENEIKFLESQNKSNKIVQLENNNITKLKVMDRLHELKDKQILVNNTKIEKKKTATLEIVEAKRKSSRSVEKLKTERKGQTPQIIQNIKITNNTTNIINIGRKEIEKRKHIENNIFKLEDLELLAKYHIDEIEITEDDDYYGKIPKNKKMLEIYNKSNDGNSLIKNILKEVFNKPDRQDERCVFYLKAIDTFLSISSLDKHKSDPIIVTDFDTILSPVFTSLLSRTYDIFIENLKFVIPMHDLIQKSDITGLQKDKTNHDKFLRLMIGRPPFSSAQKLVRKMASEVFELEITDEELKNKTDNTKQETDDNNEKKDNDFSPDV